MQHALTARIAALAVAGLALVGTAGALPAGAKAGDVRATGTCSAGATTKMKLGLRDGRIEAEVETDSNRNGQVWSVRIRQNGVLVHNGTARTAAPSGSFTVRKVLPNKTGTDTITAATRYGGQTCIVTARI